ncbi:MAG: FAD-dependent oxidoreductase [Myxococcales bacterium]|nr:FAD-dependent oxidoreductase [Myxococcales bacterium]
MQKELDRRLFLKLLSAAGATALIRCDSGESDNGSDTGGGSETPHKIVVLGAGMAGLTAAYELMKRGHEVVVLEAQSRVGGRIWTWRDGFKDGQYGEMGAVRIPDVHDQTLAYVEELGLELDEFGSGDPLYYLKGERFVHKDGDGWPAAFNFSTIEAEKGLGMWEDYIAANFDLFGNPRDGSFPAEGMMEAFDNKIYRDFLKDRGASDDWLLLYGSDQGSEINKIGTIAWMALEVADQDWDKTYHIRGGNDGLPLGLAEKLGDRIMLEHVVVGIDHDDSKVTVHYENNGKAGSMTAEHVVCAIPYSILRDIDIKPAFAADKTKCINELYMMPASRIALQTDTKFWQSEGIGGLKIAKTDTAAERLWDLSDVLDGTHGMVLAYMQYENALAFAAQSKDNRMAYLTGEIEKFFPDFGSKVVHSAAHAWSEDPWVKGAWTDILPGQGWMYPLLARAEGRIHFAGEHTSIWAGWIQGAIESGKRAANEIDSGVATGAVTSQSTLKRIIRRRAIRLARRFRFRP